MTKEIDDNSNDADAYYGDDDASTEELDLSFLDEDGTSDEQAK
ncbi:MAG TPA: hypothetical protein VMQ52_02685 [Candidatus Saccharimonadales bacterium]|jgi:hypothetical protein|nr:hypothetical protein [Candidatus Saccharimonadales bacterium]